jgi:hypothetical protein
MAEGADTPLGTVITADIVEVAVEEPSRTAKMPGAGRCPSGRLMLAIAYGRPSGASPGR